MEVNSFRRNEAEAKEVSSKTLQNVTTNRIERTFCSSMLSFSRFTVRLMNWASMAMGDHGCVWRIQQNLYMHQSDTSRLCDDGVQDTDKGSQDQQLSAKN